MVILLNDGEKPEFFKAERRRSLLSLMLLSGSPTMVIPGSPLDRSTSTSTKKASIPRTAKLKTLLSINQKKGGEGKPLRP